MSEEPKTEYPRVIWTAKDGKCRIMQTAADKCEPEELGLGFDRWNAVNGRFKELADDYCKVLGDT